MNNQAACAQRQDTSNPVVTVSGLTKAYTGGKTVLQNVALSISLENVWALSGKAAVGKAHSLAVY